MVKNKTHKVAILSDSLSALQFLSLRNINSRPDRLEDIPSINNQWHLTGIKVNRVWCPAQVRLGGYEIANVEARRALDGPIEDRIPLATTELHYSIKMSIKKKVLKRTSKSPDGTAFSWEWSEFQTAV